MEAKGEDIMTKYKMIQNLVRVETRKATKEEYDTVTAACKQNPKNLELCQ